MPKIGQILINIKGADSVRDFNLYLDALLSSFIMKSDTRVLIL